MATKKPAFLFGGKETKKEEAGEKKKFGSGASISVPGSTRGWVA